jgi:hypothetical protein
LKDAQGALIALLWGKNKLKAEKVHGENEAGKGIRIHTKKI